MKLPCRLTHSSITGSNANEGAVRLARAVTRLPHHSARHGQASRCGRASMDGAALDIATISATKAYTPGEAPQMLQQHGSG